MEIPGIDFGRLVRETPVATSAPYKLYSAVGAVPRLPRSITVETTSACQLACKMCDRSHMQRERLLMSDEAYAAIIGKIAPHPIRVNFNGIGEPLLDKKLVSRIALARAAGVQNISLITNGLLLTRELGEALINAGVNRLAVSLDSVEQAGLDAVHDGSSYATLERNLEDLIATRRALGAEHFKIVIRLTVQQENLAGIPDVYRRWHGRVQDIRVNFVYQYGYTQTRPVLPYQWNERVACPNTMETMLVLTNGATTICCLGDINAELNTGNLVTDSLEHCFSGPVAQGIRERHRALQYDSLPVCLRCSASTTSNFRNAGLARALEQQCKSLVVDERQRNRCQALDMETKPAA